VTLHRNHFVLFLIAGLASSLCTCVTNAAPADSARRYTLILEDPPVSARFSVREAHPSYRARIHQAQRSVQQHLEARGIRVLGAVDTLLNAVFVSAPASRLAELEATPGVRGVIPSRMVRPAMNRADTLVNAPAAWAALGGAPDAGKGIKIGIVDSGIDQNHPSFRDSTLPMPAGFPKCDIPSECVGFTNHKVIVARSFVEMEASGSDPHNPAADSRPDDFSPRDRLGHGTAVASAAAGESVTGLVTFNGVAPGAWLGNYKVFGSSGLNDYASDQEIIAAVDQAVQDGMDILNLSLGDFALTGPLDSGADCGLAAGVPCDPQAAALEAAAHQGVVIVVSAGNDGNAGLSYPAFGTIGSPGTTPSVITVGASSNSHLIEAQIAFAGQTALQPMVGVPAPGGVPLQALTAPLVDVASLDGDGTACAALPGGSLSGAIAVVAEGGCSFSIKTGNARVAGGVGMVMHKVDTSPLSMGSVSPIPLVRISQSDGQALQTWLAGNPGATATISGIEQDTAPDLLLHFSSTGPANGGAAIKPDLVAPGGGTRGYAYISGMYMATQSYDALGEMFNADGFIASQGTSFSAPMVAGAAALVKQAHPGFSPAQVKSALVNNAAQTVLTDDTPNAPLPTDVEWVGAGRLDAGAAVADTVTVAVKDNTLDNRYLSSLSFGVVDATSLPLTKLLTITNHGAGSVFLTLAAVANGSLGGLIPTVSQNMPAIAAGQSATINVTLSGALPAAGEYSGAITIKAPGVSLRVPWMYFVPDGVAANMIDMTEVDLNAARTVPAGWKGKLWVKLLDRYGAPVASQPVHWITDSAKSSLGSDYSSTDRNGIASMDASLLPELGDHPFWAAVGDMSLYWRITARAQPTIRPNLGVLNAASFDPDQPIGPGSYIAIFGSDLSDAIDQAITLRLPMVLDRVFVSFDVPSAGISVPGRLIYISPGQINVQVPWELSGQTSVQIKVTVGYVYGNVITVPLADSSPAFFEIAPGQVAALDMDWKVITPSHPAGRANYVQLYANGLGQVTNQPASGDPALVDPLSVIPAETPVTVSIGGESAEVGWAGLAPGFPGLYQINARVPSDLAAGNQTITVKAGGRTSKASGIVVQ
jgi:uncharacterized protein (TIGR03437 family)